jgi:hypothetical protein
MSEYAHTSGKQKRLHGLSKTVEAFDTLTFREQDRIALNETIYPGSTMNLLFARKCRPRCRAKSNHFTPV